jgi:hypothetical protein
MDLITALPSFRLFRAERSQMELTPAGLQLASFMAA